MLSRILNYLKALNEMLVCHPDLNEFLFGYNKWCTRSDLITLIQDLEYIIKLWR